MGIESVTKEQYLHEVQFALFGCQIVEEALKSFLMYARDIHRLCSSEFVQINKSDEELDEIPLSGLMTIFRQALPNSQLVSRLEQLRPQRNHCAHRALVLCFMSDVCSDISLDEEFRRVKSTRELAWSCFGDIKPELAAAERRLGTLRN